MTKIVHYSSFVLLLACMLGTVGVAAQAQTKAIEVPFVSQIPYGSWVAPWDEACEEAGIMMVDGYYARQRGEDPGSIDQINERMRTIFAWEDKNWKKNDDTHAVETKQLIERFTGFRAQVKRDPSLEDLKRELNDARPVIAMVNMAELYQDASYADDSYHVVVLTSYDEEKRQFILHDPGKQADTRYAAEVVMEALHDFNPETGEADGPPTVLTTSPSLSARTNSIFHSLLTLLTELLARIF